MARLRIVNQKYLVVLRLPPVGVVRVLQPLLVFWDGKEVDLLVTLRYLV